VRYAVRVRARGACAPEDVSVLRTSPFLALLAACSDGGLTKFNSPPEAEITSPADGESVREGTALTVRGTASDANDRMEDLSVRWYVADVETCTGTPEADGATTCTFTVPADAFDVELEVRDPDGGVGTARVTLSVTPDAPPTVDLLAPTPDGRYRSDEALELAATVSDAEDPVETLDVRWVSSIDGELAVVTTVTSTGLAGATALLSEGTHLLDVVVTDSLGNVAVDSGAFTVLPPNDRPGAPGIALTPGTPRTADDLLATIATPAVDPDGDTLTYRYAWSVDGAASGAGTGATLPSVATARGEVWTVEVYAADALGEGPPGSASVTIVNTPPSLASATLAPAAPRAADTLTCVASGWSDDDGDPESVSYAWDVGGTPVGSGPTLAGAFVTGDRVTCTATPHDGIDSGPGVTSSVTIANTPPAVTAVTLSPGSPRTGDVVTASVSASDPEGDAIVLGYAWTVDGVAVGATGASLDGTTWFDKHQVIQVTVTPYDAFGAGSPATSGTVTAVNTPPGAPVVAIDPADPEEGEDLWCEVATAATDADGDPVSYAVAWTVGGVAYPRAGDVGPATVAWPDDVASGDDTTAYETWTCTATAHDGEDTGGSGSTSVGIDPDVTRVFVTSSDYNGNTGGLAGADALCQDSADAAGIGGTWVAYLSDTGTNASTRIGAGPYVRLDGSTVATSLADLVDGSIAVPINLDEYGNTRSTWVKTGSSWDGTRGTNTSTNGLCTNWTNGCGVCYGNHFYSNSGRSYETNRNWADVGWLFCSQASAIYCFEAP
jgi:hypothetical protein